jgi:zinc protease
MTATVGKGLSPLRAQLDNGAVIIVQETSMTPAVTISATFRAGSMFDPPDRPGLSYLTGLVIDRGTERRSASLLAEALDDRGVSLKVATSRPSLTLSCTCLSEDFEDVLALLADVVRRPVFPEEEIVKRRAEAVTALRQREDNPASRAMDAALELLYGSGHPYGRRTRGTPEGLARVTRDDIVAFHARYVRPATLSLVVVGDVRPGRAIGRAAQELNGWAPGIAAPAEVPPAPAGTGRRERRLEMPGKPQSDIVYGFASVRRSDPRYYAYWMMNNILGQFGLGGRLADNIRERHGMAYYAFSTLDATAGDGPLLIRAGVDPANVDRALAAIDQEVATLGASGPSAAEVEETRAYLVGSIARMLETNESIASFLQTSEEFDLGTDFDQQLPAILKAVTLDEIREAASEVLHPESAAVAIAGPAAAGSGGRGAAS